MYNIVGETISYATYRNLLEKQFQKADGRERAFQDNVIRPFLQALLPEFDVEPVDVKIRTQFHDYTQYCGTYIDDGVTKVWTPDLCVATNWNWDNRNNIVDYRCVVEIKSPAVDPITDFDPTKYKCLAEIQSHINAKRNRKVILTDGITWAFYNSSLVPISEPICLGKLSYLRKEKKGARQPGLERTAGGKPIITGVTFWSGHTIHVDDEVTLGLFGASLDGTHDPEEFTQLKKQIVDFVTMS